MADHSRAGFGGRGRPRAAGAAVALRLGRFGDQVRRVSIYLADVNGPRGGEDKLCRIVVEVLGHGRVVVEDADHDLTVAIDRAADRVGQAVRRKLDRTRLYANLLGPTSPAGNN